MRRTDLDGRRGDPLDVAFSATAIIDGHGIVQGWSEGAELLLGYRTDEVLGRSAAVLLAEEMTEESRRSLAGREWWSGRVALRHREGRSLIVALLAHRRTSPGESGGWALETAVTGLPDRPGKPSGRRGDASVVAHDATERHWPRERLLLLNEAGTRIGSTLEVAQTVQELLDVTVPRFADFACVDLLAFVGQRGEPPPDPVTGPIVLNRTAQRSVLENMPEALGDVGSMAAYSAFSPPTDCLAVGGQAARYEMTDAVINRWSPNDPSQAAGIRATGMHAVIVAPVRARGVTLGVVCFARHVHSEPYTEDDVLLAEEITARAAICIDNARLYTRERTTAVDLQRSLLPEKLPDQTAVEVASRYLPAVVRAGVGGDWFDVIPISGGRVALVVGDVVGHGVQASATMCRIRTAVRTLAEIDLAPDELLTHLDDLVMLLSAELLSTKAETAGGFGATCLYVVYDPVTRRCTLARAGHPPPVVVTPNGTADFLDLPAGPPLGLGGLPFESVDIELPEGSLLALYTDGLIGKRGQNIEKRLDTLLEELGRPAPSLNSLCDGVLGALLSPQPVDDIALLVARTRALNAHQVATWDVESDPAVVAQVRAKVHAQLAAWGLDDLLFTTELIVSELVTNAIRYGQPPIRLRLIHDRTLICEVSDSNPTAPHMRRARVFDEGGRGLLLVAQLSQRWGTRHTRTGKTIWAEQFISAASEESSL
ncbi:GAF domain-containing protein [Streptomyces sp. ICN441]|uniref:ATP-binding SpoIIE family protein phosphatase n=1 Tax=Streptomyces sp. ICN441 TaxID=2558286 RepID=UPI00106AB93A|nr:SpoIIE family protein phosphatase [Streptomyces sp. ICN441]TFE48731.1 GAF domain-containing protein [Streptomyces sp. ICN441]